MKRYIKSFTTEQLKAKLGDNYPEGGYLYIFKHGIGPGTIPNDVSVVKVKDLPNYYTAVWLDRFLTTDELKQYDIPSETRISELLDRIGYCQKNGDVVPCDEVDTWEGYPLNACRDIKASSIMASGNNNYTVGHCFSAEFSPMGFSNPEAAIKAWYRKQDDYIGEVYIDCKNSTYQDKLLNWVLDNEDKVRQLDAKYSCMLKVDYLIDCCRKALEGNSKCYPFTDYKSVEACDKVTASTTPISDIELLAKEALNCSTRDELSSVIGSLQSIDKKLYLHYMEMLRDDSLSVAYIAGQLSDELMCYYADDVEVCDKVIASEICYRDRDNDDRVVALDVGMSDEDVEEMLAAHPSYYRSTLDRFDDVDACDNVMASSGIFYTDQGAGIGSRNQVFTEDDLRAVFNSLLAEGDPIATSYDSFEAWRDATLDSGLLGVEFLDEDVDNPDIDFDETDIDATTEPKYFANMVSASNKWPDYEKIRGAQEFLNQVATDKIRLVEKCRNALLSLYAVPGDVTEYYDIDHPIGPRESEIIRDYKCEAAEDWEDCTVEEADKLFDDIMSAIDDINADEASAWT